jgi:hypothetical protein
LRLLSATSVLSLKARLRGATKDLPIYLNEKLN